MARFVAWSPVDTLQLDMNFYDRNFYDDVLLDNVNFTFGGRTYRDSYGINGYDYPVDLLLGMLGDNLYLDGLGNLHGTVNVLFESSYGGQPMWFMDGISVSAEAFGRASSTLGNADDRALFLGILSGNDVVVLSDYADRFETGGGNDVVRAGGGGDVIFAGSGRDIVNGDGGNDRLYGGSGDDLIRGGTGNDTLTGQDGIDRLAGGAGRDALIGGAHADVFVFEGRFGRDRILDFNPDQRGERIELDGVRGITGWRDLRAHHMEQDGRNVVIHADDGSSITLANTRLHELAADDFLFV